MRPAARSGFVRTLQRIVRNATVPGAHRPVTLSESTCRNILNAADVLGRLVERLLSPRPVSARGMAMIKVLLTDGAGPLYYPARVGDLSESVHAAINALDAPVTS